MPQLDSFALKLKSHGISEYPAKPGLVMAQITLPWSGAGIAAVQLMSKVHPLLGLVFT